MKTLTSLAGLALFAALVWGCLDSESKPTPSPASTSEPSETPTPGPTAVPETLMGLPVRPLTLGAPLPFPADVALYVESGCWGCDGPAAALQRFYRAANGQVRAEDLFRLPGATVGSPTVGEKYITSLSIDGDDILLAVCEGPYCGGVGNVAAGAKTSIRHSNNGGITFTVESTIDGGVSVVDNYGAFAATGSGFGLIRIDRVAGSLGSHLAYYPTLETQPINLHGEGPASARILVPADGPPLLLRSDGRSLSRLEGSGVQYDLAALPAGATVQDFQFVPANSRVLVTFTTAEGKAYSALGETSLSLVEFKEVFRWPKAAPFFHRSNGGFIDERTWVVSVEEGRGNVPSVVDLQNATVRPIEELRAQGSGGDRMLVKGVSLGPFARVTGAGAGSCLNVRESASLSASSFACYPDGVLLKELGQRRDADGHSWTFVSTPSERQGWAAAEFLESSGAAPSLGYHHAGTRTGNAPVDAIIAALEGNESVPQSLIAWARVPCEPPPIQGIGGPPECPAGTPKDTPIDVISGAACEGYWHMRPSDGSAVRLAVGPSHRLYGVARLPASERRELAIVYANPARPEFGSAIYLTDGKIVGDSSGCGTLPSDILGRGTSILFAPPR